MAKTVASSTHILIAGNYKRGIGVRGVLNNDRMSWEQEVFSAFLTKVHPKVSIFFKSGRSFNLHTILYTPLDLLDFVVQLVGK
jgi:hypothetical protein